MLTIVWSKILLLPFQILIISGTLGPWKSWGGCFARQNSSSESLIQVRFRTCKRASLGGNCKGESLDDIKRCETEFLNTGMAYNPFVFE